MAEWPDGAALRTWLKSVAVNPAPADAAIMDEDVEAAIEGLLDVVDVTKLPVDESCPASLRRAILMRAGQFYSARGSGTADGQVHAVRWDGEVRRLITHLLPDSSAECG